MSHPRRIYKRRQLHQKNAEDREVFQINFQLEQVGATCLSIDEKFIARVVDSYTSGSQSIVIRNIDSGEDIRLNFPFNINSVNTVEFGPKIGPQIHSLFFTACDDLGRPASAYICFFDGKDCSMPELCFKDENKAHLVDVQRTKGGEVWKTSFIAVLQVSN